MREQERRQTLATFLRQKRSMLSPEDVGLPAGIRRRTPGLRREEVAQLANIGTSWYVWLEQGRPVQASPQVLESLAKALKLTANERRHLFLLSGHTHPEEDEQAGQRISPRIQLLLDLLDPAPAYLLDRHFDLLAWNNSAEKLFDMVLHSKARYERNMIWKFFTVDAEARHPHWNAMAGAILAEFRIASAYHLTDPWFDTFIEDLKQASPTFCEMWPHHDVHRELEGQKTMEHGQLGRLAFEYLTLQIPNNHDLKIMVFLPDSASLKKLRHAFQSMTV